MLHARGGVKAHQPVSPGVGDRLDLDDGILLCASAGTN
jgi:hypothetical protein